MAKKRAATPAAEPPALDSTQLVAEARALTDSRSKYPDHAAIHKLLNQLRDQRLFPELAALGVLLCADEKISPATRRLTAQALIEGGRLEEAERHLDQIIASHTDAYEVLQAHGLKGRIRKQRYVNGYFRGGKGEPAQLRRAVEAYLEAFDKDPQRDAWPGINAAALLVRAQRDGVRGLPLARAATLATEIRDHAIANLPGMPKFWHLATIAEASLVLGEFDAAELWFHRAAWCQDVKAFSLAGTLRQLREVWLLEPSTLPGSRILPPLDARLQSLGCTLMVSPAAAAVAGGESVPLEKVFGNSPFMAFQAWAQGLKCAQSVCRVEDRLDQGMGTGFLVPGKRLHPKFADELLLVTNAHVLSPKGDGDSLTQSAAHVSFYGNLDKRGRPFTAKIRKILWSSPPDALDTSIARLEKRPAVACDLSLAGNLPSANSKQKVFVIGHPSGGGLMFSLNDNELLDHGDPDDPRVHYRTPTEPGSSGSPVFNSQWELIALHHAGDAAMERIHGAGKYQANEGIAFKHIAAAIKMD